MDSDHSEKPVSAGPTGIPPGLGDTPPRLPAGPVCGEALYGAEELGSFGSAALDDDVFFGSAFDVATDVDAPASSPPPAFRQDANDTDNAALAETFCEVAGIYLRPLQHFCAELCRGPVGTSRIAPLLPPLGTVIESAQGMGLQQLAERFSSLQGYFGAIQQSGALTVEGTSREALLRVSESLAAVLPGAFGTCATGDPLEGVMLRTVLQLLPAVTTQSLEQFLGAGFTSVEMLGGADPEEVTAITGLAPHLCELTVRHAAEYLAERERRLHLSSPAEWLPVLEPRLGELERLQRVIEQYQGDSDEERRRLRRERQRAVLQLELLLAEMGQGNLLEELERQRLERRLETLRTFVAELRRPSREELVRRLATGRSLQHLDLRDQHLEGIHLPGADLSGSDLTGANLAGADLQGARFIHACLRESFLQGADLDGAQLRHAHLEGADLAHARLAGADLSRACLEAASLEGANLERACLRRVRATDAHFAKARLMGADLRGADLAAVDAGGADLRGADLGDATVAGANLRGADLRGANLPGCELNTARVEGARLEGDGGWESDPSAAVASVAAELSAAVALEAVSAAVEGLAVESPEVPSVAALEESDAPAAPVEETVPPVETAAAVEAVPDEEAPPTEVAESEAAPDPVEDSAPDPDVGPVPLSAASQAIPEATPCPPGTVSPRQVDPVPESRSRLPLGRWLWAGVAAALVLAVSVLWVQLAPEIPVSRSVAELVPARKPKAPVPVEALSRVAVEPGVPASRAVAPDPAGTRPMAALAVEGSRTGPEGPEPAKASLESLVAIAPVQPVSTAPVHVAKAEPVEEPRSAPVEMAKAAPAKQVETAPVKKAKTKPVEAPQAVPVKLAKGEPEKKVEAPPARQAATAPTEKTPKKAPAVAAPLQVAKVAPAKKTQREPVETAPAKVAPQAALKDDADVVPSVPSTSQRAGSASVAASELLSVAFLDPNLEACVRTTLGRPTGALSAADVAGLSELTCSTPEAGGEAVTRLEGIEALVGLVTLDLSSNRITDIGPLASLGQLRSLNLRANRIADIGPVAALPGACEIDLWQNPIDDITPLLMRSRR